MEPLPRRRACKDTITASPQHRLNPLAAERNSYPAASCVDDPHDKCDPTKDGLNCPGMCVAGGGAEQKVKQPCGGPSRIQCQGGMVCVDDTSDNCDPTRDGLDCKGMCVAR
jgi:hypothetical protein